MLLSVITPDNQPGMKRMLEKELSGIDSEIIIENFDEGLKLAKGDFVCFLESNSGLKEGSLKQLLSVFTEKPAYRKLAMVSPMFELPGMNLNIEAWLSYSEGLVVNTNPKVGAPPTKIGMFLGAVIRTSSLKKSGLSLTQHPMALSAMLSIFLWDNGLRVHLNAKSMYQGAEDVDYIYQRPFTLPIAPSDKVSQIWKQEWIA